MSESEKNRTASGDIWVYAQTRDNKMPAPVVCELLGIGRTLADRCGVRLCAVLPGYHKQEAARELTACGADLVYLAEHELLAEYSTDAYTEVLEHLIRQERPEILLFGGTDEGRDLAPRIAARVRTGLTVDCTELKLDEENGELCQIRPAFGSRLMAEIRTGNSRPQMCTVRPGMFEKAARDVGRTGEIRSVQVSLERKIRTRVLTSGRMERTVDLRDARVVVAGGMGIGGKDGFKLLEGLAFALNGAVGGTRAALNEGWITHDQMIGQTGTVTAPDLYIACGISGAVQHMLGVSGAKCIVAVNSSPDAPIFGDADYGIVADYREFIPRLLEELKAP